MRPYYEDDFVTLFHGDALDVPEWLSQQPMHFGEWEA